MFSFVDLSIGVGEQAFLLVYSPLSYASNGFKEAWAVLYESPYASKLRITRFFRTSATLPKSSEYSEKVDEVLKRLIQ
jgi:hypothetical protein